MTISQGLRHSKKLKGQLAELQARAQNSVSYKADQKPAFLFGQTVEQIDRVRSDLIEMETRLAVTNATTKIDYAGRKIPLTSAVRTLQELKSFIAWLRGLTPRAHEDTYEEEIEWNDTMDKRIRIQTKWTCDFPEAKRIERVDACQSDFDRLNDAVERANNVTELVKL